MIWSCWDASCILPDIPPLWKHSCWSPQPSWPQNQVCCAWCSQQPASAVVLNHGAAQLAPKWSWLHDVHIFPSFCFFPPFLSLLSPCFFSSSHLPLKQLNYLSPLWHHMLVCVTWNKFSSHVQGLQPWQHFISVCSSCFSHARNYWQVHFFKKKKNLK